VSQTRPKKQHCSSRSPINSYTSPNFFFLLTFSDQTKENSKDRIKSSSSTNQQQTHKQHHKSEPHKHHKSEPHKHHKSKPQNTQNRIGSDHKNRTGKQTGFNREKTEFKPSNTKTEPSSNTIHTGQEPNRKKKEKKVVIFFFSKCCFCFISPLRISNIQA